MRLDRDMENRNVENREYFFISFIRMDAGFGVCLMVGAVENILVSNC